jgi:hypothetical protein
VVTGAPLKPLWIESALPGDVVALNCLSLVGLRPVSPTLGDGLDASPLDVRTHFWIVIGRGECIAGEVMLAVLDDLLVGRHLDLATH